jgi:deoxycytidylate deaminase
MYCTWFPCAGCARMIVNAGIKKIICGERPDLNNEKFGKEFKIVLEMLHEADVDIEYELTTKIFKIDVGNVPEHEVEKIISDIRDKYINNGDSGTFFCGCKGACDCID